MRRRDDGTGASAFFEPVLASNVPSGVSPFALRALRSAPRSASTFTTSPYPWADAICTAVSPAGLTALISLPSVKAVATASST